MANTLLITKLSDGSFSFVVNGDVINTIINLRNDLTTVGNECHFKTSEGANLIKLQQILYHEVIIVDGATLPVASSPLDLRIKLISVGFWDWMNPAGGGVSNRFDLLLDTFSYFGNNGKIPMVDESQLKLVPYSLPDFSYLNLFPTPLVADKGLKVNSLATAYELYDIVNTITQFIRLGYTATAPSEDIVYKALELKANLSDIPVLPDYYANIVYVNDVDPNSATIFDLNNPPTVNDNSLKEGVSNLYVGTDASTWVYNLATLTYVTKVISSEFSNFYLAGTTSDAGGNKTASIERSGTVGATGFKASGETANTIAGFDANKAIKSLPTATYPSLTELSYIKGLTSSAQTQINARALDNNVVHLSGNETRTDGTLTFKTASNANANIVVNPDNQSIKSLNTSGNIAWQIFNTAVSQGGFNMGTPSAYIYGRNGGPLELGASIPFIVPNSTDSTHAINKGQLDLAISGILLKSIKIVAGTSYTLLSSDIDKILHFTSSTAVTLTVPTGLVVNGRYEGKQIGDGQISFVQDGTLLHKGLTNNLKTAQKYSPFAIDFEATETYIVYGELELL